ncbi:alpha/beta hydrolase [Natronolimnohabitans innermongolicus]|uniref:Phospholipase/Carboxylesterase n=1 Tax=Natronolimnohabitans innermongolicus JCM 12255 TaxID=1227499 RepID=L9X5S9_9EURY|nr:dienelactone hydrolase family protein [Natronolimnohabitans innermongolicus]ELY57025.1 phospholipase/Carboxylesterase [Natronolimnohabitans innermongolicus JCM 12255]
MTGSDSGERLTGVSGPHAHQPLVTAGAPALAAEAALVCCHGRGATAQGVINLLNPVSRHGVAVLAPQAERSRWYPRRASEPRSTNEPWLSSSVDCVRAALERADAIGVPPERTVVTGFSQGACVAAEFVRRNPVRYGGLAILSATLPGSIDELESATIDGPLAGTPVLIGYGEDDPHVDPEHAAETARVFSDADAAVDDRCYPETGHVVTDDEFDAIGSMLETALEGGD